MIDDCLAVIMAGGDSQRMGRDKASLVLGEQTLMQRVAEIMQVVFPQVVVSVRSTLAPASSSTMNRLRSVYRQTGWWMPYFLASAGASGAKRWSMVASLSA